VITAKQRELCAQIEPLLREHSLGGSGSILAYLPLRDLRAMLTYLTDTPRVTAVGATMTAADAARIIGVTLRGRGDMRLAMRLDCLDNQYNKILMSLRKTGVTIASDDLKEISDEDVLRYSALLHAEDKVFTNFHYHKDYKNGKVDGLYRYVEENPTQASRIMGVAKQRYSLDVALIKAVLASEAPALETGVL
jgi:hypothetical protein